jgi:hypothetical protein
MNCFIIIICILLLCFMFLHLYLLTEMKVCPSLPSSEDHYIQKKIMFEERRCRRSETGGSLSRRVNVAACPSPDGSSARASAKGGEARRPETGVREVGILRPSCSSRAQVGCACSRGLQASTQERERAASSERLSRPRPRAANPL